MADTADPPRRAELVDLVQQLTPEDFVSHHVLDRVPWLFADRTQYVVWRARLAEYLELDPFNLIVVGSACIGRSLSPTKDLSPFRSTSDVDVAVVSPRHFDAAWRWLRNLGPIESLATKSFEFEILRRHRRSLIFDGAIATDQILGVLPFGSRWAVALAEASAQAPIDGRDVRVRIYRDFESVREYHVNGIRKLRSLLPISAEDDAATALLTLDDEETV